MNSAVQLYILLLIAGLFLIGAEIFLPGGVIGALGGLSLLAAMVLGFAAFGLQGGLASALAIVVLTGLCIALWVRYFPKTTMGRSLTLRGNGKSFKAASPELIHLAGKEGVAVTPLRPAGLAAIEGRRVDVLADGAWIASGRPIRVERVEGNRVLVREISSAERAAS